MFILRNPQPNSYNCVNRSVAGGIVAPQKDMPTPALQSVTLFGIRVFADGIKLKIS